MYCALIVLVATGGKLGGSMLASWLTGMATKEAAGLGTLMNTRGLMELVILNIGPRHQGHLTCAIFHDDLDGVDHILHDVTGAGNPLS